MEKRWAKVVYKYEDEASYTRFNKLYNTVIEVKEDKYNEGYWMTLEENFYFYPGWLEFVDERPNIVPREKHVDPVVIELKEEFDVFIKLSQAGQELIKKIDAFTKCYPSIVETSANNTTQMVQMRVAGYTIVFMVDKPFDTASFQLFDSSAQCVLEDHWNAKNKEEEHYAFETVIETLQVYGVTI